MPESTRWAGAWLSRGLLLGPLIVVLYFTLLGPAVWLIEYLPSPWQEWLFVVFIPYDWAMDSELIPDWVWWPHCYWMEWWGDL